MRHEFARVGRYAHAVADTVDFSLQGRHARRGGDACPDRVRLLLAKGADTGERQRERRPPHTVEFIGDVVGDVAGHVADETQGDVIVFDVYPAGAGQTSPEKREREGSVTRNFEGGEKTWHWQPPVPESNSLDLANHR